MRPSSPIIWPRSSGEKLRIRFSTFWSEQRQNSASSRSAEYFDAALVKQPVEQPLPGQARVHEFMIFERRRERQPLGPGVGLSPR